MRGERLTPHQASSRRLRRIGGVAWRKRTRIRVPPSAPTCVGCPSPVNYDMRGWLVVVCAEVVAGRDGGGWRGGGGRGRGRGGSGRGGSGRGGGRSGAVLHGGGWRGGGGRGSGRGGAWATGSRLRRRSSLAMLSMSVAAKNSVAAAVAAAAVGGRRRSAVGGWGFCLCRVLPRVLNCSGKKHARTAGQSRYGGSAIEPRSSLF